MEFARKQNQSGHMLAFVTTVSPPLIAGTLLSLVLLAQSLAAQNVANAASGSVSATNSNTTVQVPRLIRVSGTLTPPSPSSGNSTINVTFSLYTEETGGTPLWQESQNVELDATGHYTVLLGSTQAEGLPVELFTSGQAQWLGLRPAGEAEQPRIMLVSVPFALKAGDAETLGGKPASAYLTAPLVGANTGIYAGATGVVVPKPARANASSPNNSVQPASAVTGKGTADYVPLWTSSSSFGNSVIYENTTKSYIGIGTTAPVSTLNVQVGSSATAPAIEASTTTKAKAAILGTNSVTSENTGVGVEGEVSGPSAYGIVGMNTSTETGTTEGAGVYGSVASPAAWGVWGVNSATSDIYGGVYGTSASPDGIGVKGLNSNTADSGTGGIGVLGVTNSPNGYGVYGSATEHTGANFAVYGVSPSPDGLGVYGVNSSTTGDAYGVGGATSSSGTYASAIFGEALADTGVTYGVSGETHSTTLGAAAVNGYVAATTGTAYGVQGETYSTTEGATGVYGYEGATTGEVVGVYGYTASTTEGATAVWGNEGAASGTVYGVYGQTVSTTDYAAGTYGYEGATTGLVFGVTGNTASTTEGAAGVHGYEAATTGAVAGVLGATNSTGDGAAGVTGSEGATSGVVYGVYGYTPSTAGTATGVYGDEGATTGLVYGVAGYTASTTDESAGVYGYEGATTGDVSGVTGGTASPATGATGVYGYNNATSGAVSGIAAQVKSPDGAAAYLITTSTGYIVEGNSSGSIVFSVDHLGDGDFTGKVTCSGCSDEMDDPVDPANKYLYHSSVESPDMMNVYNGNITTNANGVATVVLPNYFETLNRDFRYQLTVIGQFAQAIVAQEISHNQFTIKTSQPNVKVSWQVTGIRQDPWANAHRTPTEVDKPADKRGYYLHPELYGAGPDKNIHPGLVTAEAKALIPPPQPHSVAPPARKTPPIRSALPARPAMRRPPAPQVPPTSASAMLQNLRSAP